MQRKFLFVFLFLLLVLLTMASGCLPGGSEETAAPVNAEPARPAWQQIYTDITFSGPSLGLISGWHGTILRSTDTGQTWSEARVDSKADLNSVAILEGNTAVAVGSGGNILRSTDGGITWIPVDSPTGETLNRVASISGGGAVAVGWHGTIIHTEDGGITWSDQSRGLEPSLYFEDVDFTPDGVGMTVSSNGRVFRTTNAKDWHELTIPGEGVKLFGVDLYDADIAYLAGNLEIEKAYLAGGKTVVLKTANGGIDWAYGPRDMSADLLGIQSVGPRGVVTVGWNGTVWRSADAGGEWQPAISHTNQALRAIAAADATTVCAVGDGQTIITSRNAGYTWVKLRGS
ncbi:MAG: YCF48-related protein [Thermoleophilia bacterium]